MKIELSKPVILTAAVATVAFVAGAVVTSKGLFSAEMAAWVQAFGSIGAIIGAVWLQGRQHRMETFSRSTAAIRVLYGASRRVRQLMRKVKDGADNGTLSPGRIVALHSRFEAELELIDAVPAINLNSPKAVAQYTNLRLIAADMVLLLGHDGAGATKPGSFDQK